MVFGGEMHQTKWSRVVQCSKVWSKYFVVQIPTIECLIRNEMDGVVRAFRQWCVSAERR